MYWCFHCYAVNQSDSGPCVRCGRAVQGRAGRSFDEQLIWTLGHPDGDRAIVAAHTLAQRRTRSALPALRQLVDAGEDPFLAVAALRSAISIASREELHGWLEALVRSDSFMVRAVAREALRRPG